MMNGTHQVYLKENNIMQNYCRSMQKQDISFNKLRSCINIKNNCSKLYFDSLPNEIIAKILGNLPLQDLIRVSATTPAFESEAQRVIKLLDGKSKSEIIFQLAAQGDVSALSAIKNLGVDLGRIIDHETGDTLLHHAVNANISSVIDFTLNLEGIDLNAKNLAGFTPLMIAVSEGDFLRVNTLINRHGVDINKIYDINNNKECNRGYGEYDFVFNLLQEKVSGSPALHFAVHAGNFDVLDLFCKNEKTDIELVDNYGNTALMKAIAKKENRMARLILARNDMALCQKNQGGGLLLHIALLHDNVDILPDLLEKKLDVNRCDGQGNAALHLATLKGSSEAVSLLLSSPGLNINALNRGEWTAHNIALSQGNAQIARLIEDCANRQLQTPTPVKCGLGA